MVNAYYPKSSGSANSMIAYLIDRPPAKQFCLPDDTYIQRLRLHLALQFNTRYLYQIDRLT